VQIIEGFYPPAISTIAEYLDPADNSLWNVTDIEEYMTTSSGW